MSSTNLPEVCRFLRTKREQVSGLEQQQDALSETACEAEAKQTLYDRFIGALRDHRPLVPGHFAGPEVLLREGGLELRVLYM